MQCRHRSPRLLVLSAVAAILIVPATAVAAEHTLWQRSASYPLKQKSAQAASWRKASQAMASACKQKADTRKAVGRVRLPGAFLQSVRSVFKQWPAGSRSAGFDDACAISRSFRAVEGAIMATAPLCERFKHCPATFTIYERETKQATTRAPDICRWTISLWVTGPPAAVISTPC